MTKSATRVAADEVSAPIASPVFTGTVTADNLQVSGTGVSDLQRSHSTTTAPLAVLDIKAKSNGDMAAGFGSAQRFIIEDTANVENVVAEIAARRESSDSTASLTFTTSATERMRIDAAGNVGIGVTPEDWYSSYSVLQVGGVGAIAGETLQGVGSATRYSNNVYLNSGGSWAYQVTDEASLYQQADGVHTFRVAPSGSADSAISWTDAMTVKNNAGVSIGSTGGDANHKLFVYGNVVGAKIETGNTGGGAEALIVERPNDGVLVAFLRAGVEKGSITVNSSATAYNTSSDYRLKENVTPMSGATAQTKLLKPCNFDWIAGGNVNGFLAHELAEVVPEAVTGTKDAMRDEEYEVTPATDTEAAVMGTRSVPDLQGIDQSKLVPLLTATIQELIARIEALEA